MTLAWLLVTLVMAQFTTTQAGEVVGGETEKIYQKCSRSCHDIN
jgi:hypothetical protein